MPADAALLEVRGLGKRFPVAGARAGLRAVDDVSFAIRRGEVLALVGESGSGKSTIGRLALRLLDASAGAVVFDGIDLASLPRGALRRLRRRMQMIFQDPYAALNPYLRVRELIGEALEVHGIGTAGSDRLARVIALLDLVGLDAGFVGRFAHELSGGQRQRVAIARALAVAPDFLVADEAVSALDVSNQAQILDVLADLRRRLDLTMLFISHNLAVVRDIADRVAVVYLGRLVEIAPAARLFAAPAHPYTAALLSAIPIPDPDLRRKRIILRGDIPSPLDPPTGCVFRTRCPHAFARCAVEVPALREQASGQFSACHLDPIQ